jgi:hypothetical protein
LTDRKATLLHELREVREMLKGKEYEEAHNDIANPLEIEARHNPSELDEMLSEELEEHESKPRRRVYNNERERVPVMRSRRVSREKEEVGLPSRYYLGRKLRPTSLGVNL